MSFLLFLLLLAKQVRYLGIYCLPWSPLACTLCFGTMRLEKEEEDVAEAKGNLLEACVQRLSQRVSLDDDDGI